MALASSPRPVAGQHQRRVELPADFGEHRAGGLARLTWPRPQARTAATLDRTSGPAAIGAGSQGRRQRAVTQPGCGGEVAQGDGTSPRAVGKPERRGVARDRPALLGRQPALIGRHGGARDTDRDAAIEVERCGSGESPEIGEIRGHRRKAGGSRAVASANRSMTGGTLGLIHPIAQGHRWSGHRYLFERDRELPGQCGGKGPGPERHRIGRRGPGHHGNQRVDRSEHSAPDIGRQQARTPARLLEEELGFGHLLGSNDLSAHDADRVLLGGERGGGGDSTDGRWPAAPGLAPPEPDPECATARCAAEMRSILNRSLSLPTNYGQIVGIGSAVPRSA